MGQYPFRFQVRYSIFPKYATLGAWVRYIGTSGTLRRYGGYGTQVRKIGSRSAKINKMKPKKRLWNALGGHGMQQKVLSG